MNILTLLFGIFCASIAIFLVVTTGMWRTLTAIFLFCVVMLIVSGNPEWILGAIGFFFLAWAAGATAGEEAEPPKTAAELAEPPKTAAELAEQAEYEARLERELPAKRAAAKERARLRHHRGC